MVKHIILVAVAVCAAGGACWAGGARGGAGPRFGRELTKAVDAFGINFLQEAVNLEPTKNVVTSPLSASALFALLSLGADGETHDEIINVLKLKDDDFTRAAFKEATATLAATPNVTLEVVNRLFIADNGFTLAPAFQNDATDVFNAGLETINFNRGKEAAKTINRYVEGATHNRIKDLIGDSDLTSDTRLVLINAIYFKGTWKTRFSAKRTRDRSFFTGPGRTAQVPTMSIHDEYDYAESDYLGVQIVELPYVGEEVSMLVVLPRSRNGLDRLLQQLSTHDGVSEITAAAQRLAPTQVHLRLPRFKVETEVDLKEVFTKLGAGKAFDQKQANLSRLATGAEPLYVFKAAQKAFVEVNEEGAEAAAASAAMIYGRSARVIEQTPVKFHAHQPFLWLLRTRSTHLTLFSGVYRGL